MAGFMFDDDPFGSSSSPFPKFPGFGSGAQARPTYRKPFDDAEQADHLKTLVGHTTSALQYGLSSLNKPGRAVRGVLGGKPHELLSLIPFSDSVGLTDESDQVTGRDLTDKLHLTRTGNEGWRDWGVGLAADVATDPLTYLTLGANNALTPAGKALKGIGATKGWSREALLQGFHGLEPELLASGQTAAQITHRVNQGQRIATPEMIRAAAGAGQTLRANTPLAGLAQFGIPFGPKAAPFLTGAPGAARGLDRAVKYLRFENPIGRGVGALFDHNVNGAVGKMTQMGWSQHGTPALEAAQAAARQHSYDLIHRLNPIIKSAGIPENDVLKATIRAAETLPSGAPAAVAGQVDEAGRYVRSLGEGWKTEARSLGLPLEDVADPFIPYVPRQSIDVNARATQLRDRNIFPTASGSNIHRDLVYRGIPGGQTGIDDWVMRFAGQAVPGLPRLLKKEMVADMRAGGFPMSRAVGKQLDASAKAMAERLGQLDARHVTKKIPLYNPDLVRTVAKRDEQAARTTSAGRAALGIIGDNAKPVGQLGGDFVTVPEIIRSLGMRTWKADQKAGTPITGALPAVYQKLAKAGAGPVDPFLGGKVKALKQAAAGYGLTRDQAAELLKAHGQWSMPEVTRGPIKFLDDITNTFKNLTYPIWLPSHVRNAASAGLNNLTDATPLRAYGAQARLMRETATAGELRRLVPDLPAGLTDEAARDWVRGRQFASAKIFGGHNAITDQPGSIPELLQNGGRITPELPGSGRRGPTGSAIGDVLNLVGKGAADQVKQTGGKLSSFRPFGYGQGWGRLNPRNWTDPTKPWGLGMKGVGGAITDTMPALKAGRMAGTNIEDFFRGANWLGGTARGRSAEEAGRVVNKLHFDYDALSGFEKRVMRRLVPFYTFARKNLPLQAEMLATRPGIPVAQMRAMAAGRNPSDYVPDYLAGGAAIPTGPEEDGKRQFVSQFGTPIEEALERFKFKGGLPDVGGTALSYMGTMNPLLKAPLERLFDTQFHTGRKLSTLKSPRAVSAFGRLFGEENPQLLAQILANSPATRFLSAADKAIDERKPAWAKALNLATGARVTDVDLDQMRAVEAAQARNEILGRMPHVSSYTNFYVKPEQAANLTPDEVEWLRASAGLTRDAKEYAARRRRIGVRQ